MWTITRTLEKHNLSLDCGRIRWTRSTDFLHIIDWGEGRTSDGVGLVPDYNKSSCDLMLECMEILFRGDEMMHMPAWNTVMQLMIRLGLQNM